MTPRALAQLLGYYTFFLVCSCLVLHKAVSLAPVKGAVVASAYKEGVRVARAVVERADLASASGVLPTEGTTVAFETVTEESAIATFAEPVFAMSLVSGCDGVRVDMDGKTAYVTPDDLVSKQGYDHGLGLDSLNLALGADVALIIALASQDLGVRPSEVKERASFHRIRTTRVVPGAVPVRYVPAEMLTPGDVRSSVVLAARYLGRGVSPDGHFRYLVDAASNKSLPGYDWPRHAGATYFLVQATRLDPSLIAPARRALSQLTGHALVPCGVHQCIGEGDTLEIGSISLGTIALAEAVRSGLDRSVLPMVRALADTIVSLQREDGEFMHLLDRDGHAQDVQLLYFSGEATLALARAHEVTGDERYLEGAKKGLAHLVGPAWSFFGDRYYFGEEHWTCQAMGDLWDRAPDPVALDFCERWQDYGRKLQMRDGEGAWDADGAIGVGPVVTPRLTPVASRCEAGVATLDALRKSHASPERIEALRDQMRRALALLVREQFHGQSRHLFANPDAIDGAMPGSEVDWQLRIDYAQHAGSAMVRWLEVEQAK